MARHLGADGPVDVGKLNIQPALVAIAHRPVRRAGDRPDRRCRYRSELSGPAGDRTAARRWDLLRLAGPHESAQVRTGERACRPVSRAPDRDHRRSRTSVPELADHRDRPRAAPALAGPRGGRGPRYSENAGQLLRLPEQHRERTRAGVHPGGRSRRAVAARPHLHRDGEPVVRRQARRAFRRDAARRGHSASGLGDLSCRGDGCCCGGRGARVRSVLPDPTVALSRPLYGGTVGPR